MTDDSMIYADYQEPRPVTLRFSARFGWWCLCLLTVGIPAGFGAAGILRASHLERLRTEGVQTDGTVVQTWEETRRNKSTSWVVVMVRYAFDAEGAQYQSVAEVHVAEGRTLPVGARIAVVYQPGNPADHLRYRPTEDNIWSELWLWLGFGAAIGAGGAILLFWLGSYQSKRLRLARFGVETPATITAWTKGKGVNMAYRFFLGRQEFKQTGVTLALAAGEKLMATAGGVARPVAKRTGWAAFFMGQPETPMVGRTLPVLYDQANPRINLPRVVVEDVVAFLPTDEPIE